MGYNSSIYKRIYDEYSQKYLIARERADIRAQEVRRAIPEIAKIDRELSLTGLEVFSASLSGGDTASKIAEIRAKNESLQARRAELLVANGFVIRNGRVNVLGQQLRRTRVCTCTGQTVLFLPSGNLLCAVPEKACVFHGRIAQLGNRLECTLKIRARHVAYTE